MKKCIIVGAGEFDITNWQYEPQDYMIAADAGWMILNELNVLPDILIGDMDSLEEHGIAPEKWKTCKVELLPTHKDDTDMLAAIRRGLELGCDEFHIYGSLGGRLDHTLANIQCLLFLHNRGAKGILYGKKCSLELLCNGIRRYPASMKGRISVFAFTRQAKGVTEKGLCYTLDKAVLDAEFPVGVSNEFMGCESSVEVEDGMLLLYTEND